MARILVIEDTAEVRKLITDTLQLAGFQVFAAEDGEFGVQMALEHLPDLILCDVQMPRKDGFEVLAELRRQKATATIPFVFLTGQSGKSYVRQGMDLGADDFLAKPFQLEELLAAVNARLEKHRVFANRSDEKLVALRDSISLALPHELMTPLNGIIGFSAVLISDIATLPKSDVLEFAHHIHDSAQRLQRVIENFLLYSQLELAAADPAKMAALREAETGGISHFINAVAVRKAGQAGRQADLGVQVQEARLKIAGPKLEKLLWELLDNAFKFSDPGTPVRLHGQLEDGSYRLEIIDHGRGLSPEHIAALGAHMQFERKFHEQQGSGLGFAIARRMAEVHGGAISLRSTRGEATVVEVVLPASA